MKRGLQKEVMVNLLKHPAEVFYKDDSIVVVKADTKESVLAHLGSDVLGAVSVSSDADKYVVYTYNTERFLMLVQESTWDLRTVEFKYTFTSPEQIISEYPSLITAFDSIARSKDVLYLPLVADHDDGIVHLALKRHSTNIKHVRGLSQKDMMKWLHHYPECFEHIEQNTALVKYAVEKLDVPLGWVASEFCTGSICKRAVKNQPTDIQYVPNQHNTPELKLAAIKQDPVALKYIPHPTFDMYVQGVKSGKNGWEYVPISLKKKVKKALR